MTRHLLDLTDLDAVTTARLLKDAACHKERAARGEYAEPLRGKVVALVFEKPSLRTRVSFEAGITRLGGKSLFMAGNEVGLGVRETPADFARTMSQFVDALVLRVFRHTTVEEVAKTGAVPVVNGLSDTAHPCQVLADLQTLQELFGELSGRTVVFVGDGNNVARSLALGCGMLGVRFVLSAPPGYAFDDSFLALFRKHCPKGKLEQNSDPRAAVKTADAIYTDVWTSMGQEEERAVRLKEFAPYQVNAALLKLAPAHAKLLHCLPAHRGEEVTADVIDGPRSAVFQQAGNRLYAQMAVLAWLFT